RPRRALQSVRAHAGEHARAAGALVPRRVLHLLLELAQVVRQLVAHHVAGEPRRRRLHRLPAKLERPRRLGVVAALGRRPRDRDVLGCLHAHALPFHLHGHLLVRRGHLQGPPHDGVFAGGDVDGSPGHRVAVRAAELDQLGGVLRGFGDRHVDEQEEAPLLVGVELADFDRRGAAVCVDAALVAPRLDLPDEHARARARHGDARVLHGDGKEPSDALRERVLDGRLVLDEGDRAARRLRDGVHRRRVVVGAEAERRVVVGVAVVAAARRHGVRVLAVGEEDDALDGVPVEPVVEHLGGLAERRPDVGAAARREGPHGALRVGLAGVGHARQPHQAARAGGEGDDAEAVAGAEVVDDEPHGLLQQRQLVPHHAPAHVEHGHQVERRPLRLGGGAA
ncbi:hypothetical protein EE612_051723, partial [Oryza sativa]